MQRVLSAASSALGILQSIHSLGVIHCDIKPDNMILLENGELQLIDFGQAIQMNDTHRSRYPGGTLAFSFVYLKNHLFTDHLVPGDK